jgi:hypothetical protein
LLEATLSWLAFLGALEIKEKENNTAADATPAMMILVFI